MLVVSLVVAAAVFIGFLSLVGSPSEVETIIGLVLAAVAFIASFVVAWRVKRRFQEEDKDEKILDLEREIAELKSRK